MDGNDSSINLTAKGVKKKNMETTKFFNGHYQRTLSQDAKMFNFWNTSTQLKITDVLGARRQTKLTFV